MAVVVVGAWSWVVPSPRVGVLVCCYYVCPCLVWQCAEVCLVIGEILGGCWWFADGSAVVVSIMGEGAVASVVAFAVVAVRD